MRIAFAIAGGLVLLLFAVCEVAMSFPVAWYLYILVAMAFAAAFVRRAPLRSQRIQLTTLFVLLALIAALYFVEWTSRKPFLRDLYRIRVGMTEAEVRQIMERYMEGTGWSSPYSDPAPSTLNIVGNNAQYRTNVTRSGELTLRDSLVFRHSNEAAFDSDWGIVTLSKGRVTRVEFSPD